MGLARRFLGHRSVAVVLALAAVVGVASPVGAAPPPSASGQLPATPDWLKNLQASTPDDDPVVPPFEPGGSAEEIQSTPLDTSGAAVELPAPGVAEVTLGAEGAEKQAEGLPVTVAAGDSSERGVGVRIEVLDQVVSQRAGVSGFAFRVLGDEGTDLAAIEAGGDEMPATLSLDYSGFKDLYGAGYADRLQVVAVPECALVDPVPAECDIRQTVLPSDNDRSESRLTVDVADLTEAQGTPLVAASETEAAPVAAGDSGVVLAVTSGADGPGGSFTATPFSASGDWQVGVGSGEFSWSWGMPLTSPPGGTAPSLGVSYSSGGVDAMVTSKNTQASPMGLGWGDFADSFIERRYNTCEDEGTGTTDLCWANDNATISLNGRASELVPTGSNDQWRLKDDPRWKVERLHIADLATLSNGDNDGEYWKVTSPDGTQYWFGLGRDPAGTHWETNSTWWAPVIGDDPGEPCHDSAGWYESMCVQAWRWNLDWVIDPNGNGQAFIYRTESNNYAALNGWPGLAQFYITGGQIVEVQYGRRDGVGPAQTAKVTFELGWRCSTLDAYNTPPCESPDTPGQTFPDVPTDMRCPTPNNGTCLSGATSPTFFTAKRYADARAYVRSGNDWVWVDRFLFSHAFQDPDNDPGTTDDAKLWLTGIQRIGFDGGQSQAVALPPVTFGHTALNNRHNPGDGESAMPHWRVNQITDEFGGQTNVTYGQPHPCGVSGDQNTADWANNTTDCFPQKWAPEGSPDDPTFRAFNKYVTTQVEVKDTTGGSPSMATSYFYGDQINGQAPQSWNASRDQAQAAWHHDNKDPWVLAEDQSWSDWRGYQDVLVVSGSTRTRYKVHRGMNGDRSGNPAPNDYRNVALASLDGTITSTPDENWLAGAILDEVALRSDGTPESGTVHGYQAIRTVDAPNTCGDCAADRLNDAWWVGENDTVRRRRTPASDTVFARQRTQTYYNLILQVPEMITEHGWTDQNGDERCTTTSYAINVAKWMLDYPALITRYPNASCNQTAINRSDIAYDGLPVGQGPTRGNPTTTRTQISGTAPTDGTWASTSTTYDMLGRPLEVTDPNGNKTTTTYTPAAPTADPNQPVDIPTQITVTNIAGHTATTTFSSGASFLRQLPASTIDTNGNTTTYAYDALGRVTSVWQPTEPTSGPASWTFAYDIDEDKSQVPVIETAQLQDLNGPSGSARYLKSWVVYDSLLRERQTQTVSPASTAELPKTLVAETSYDGRGQVSLATQPQAVAGTAGAGVIPVAAVKWMNRTQTDYDHVSRPSRVIDFHDSDADGDADDIYRQNAPTYTHNSVDSRWTIGTTTTGAGTRTLTVTDAYDRTIRIDEHDGSSWRPTSYGYDMADRLVSVTDTSSNKITYSYDMAGRRTKAVDPDAGTWEYAYDAASNQRTVKDATNAVVTVKYDNLNRPTERHQTSDTGPLLASWTYDAPGQLGLPDKSTRFAGSDAWVTDITGYDTRSRPTGRSWIVPTSATGLAGTYTVGYEYDRADHQTKVKYPTIAGLPAEDVTTTYNSIGLPEGLNGATQYVYAAAYDDRGRPGLFGFGQASAYTMGRFWSYDANQRLSRQVAGTSAGTVQDRTISYDIVGNITERNTSLNGGAFRECYKHDVRDRLTDAWTTSPSNTCPSGTGKGTGANPYDHRYTYTVDGNLKTRVEGGVTTTYTYPAGGANSVRPHALTAVGSNSYTWNANGNQATRTLGGQTQSLAWDPEHRLASITSPTGNSGYIYDAGGQRLLRQTPQGKTLYIEGHEITAPTSGTTTAVRSYGFGSLPVATRTPTTVEFLATDNQGSVELTVPQGGGGTPNTVRTYLPYGKVRTGGQPATDHTWIGQVEDDHTGLQYLNARYYDPTIGVFTAPDPVAVPNATKSWNPYQYAHNNPTTNTDPTGENCVGDGLGGVCVPHGSRYVPGQGLKNNPGSGGGITVTTTHRSDEPAAGSSALAQSFFENNGNLADLEGDYDSCLGYGSDEGCTLTAVSLTPEDLFYGLLAYLEQEARQSKNVGQIVDLLGIGLMGACGFLPICGEALDLTSAVYAVLEGEWQEAGLNAASLAIPFYSYKGLKSADEAAALLADANRACSFDADTTVLMANGERKRIADVEVGDEVLATNPETGETGPRQVIATLPHTDQLLTLKTSVGEIVTTQDHKYWNATDHQWQESQLLDPGDRLLSADGDEATVDGLDWTTLHTGAAYDLDVADLDTFYVGAGEEAVLVHNTGCDEWADDFIEAHGGEAKTFTPSEGRVFPEGSYAHQPQGEAWFHHTVVVKDGKVFDQFNENGIPIDDYKGLWGDLADETDFGF